MTLAIDQFEPAAVASPARTLAPVPPPSPAAPRRGRAGTCGHPIWGEPGGLTCIREPDHEPGHVYRDQHGSAVDDRHTNGGHG